MILGGHEVLHDLADEIAHAAAQHSRELVVGIQEDAGLGDRDAFEGRGGQAPESLFALPQGRIRRLALDHGPETAAAAFKASISGPDHSRS